MSNRVTFEQRCGAGVRAHPGDRRRQGPRHHRRDRAARADPPDHGRPGRGLLVPPGRAGPVRADGVQRRALEPPAPGAHARGGVRRALLARALPPDPAPAADRLRGGARRRRGHRASGRDAARARRRASGAGPGCLLDHDPAHLHADLARVDACVPAPAGSRGGRRDRARRGLRAGCGPCDRVQGGRQHRRLSLRLRRLHPPLLRRDRGRHVAGDRRRVGCAPPARGGGARGAEPRLHLRRWNRPGGVPVLRARVHARDQLRRRALGGDDAARGAVPLARPQRPGHGVARAAGRRVLRGVPRAGRVARRADRPRSGPLPRRRDRERPPGLGAASRADHDGGRLARQCAAACSHAARVQIGQLAFSSPGGSGCAWPAANAAPRRAPTRRIRRRRRSARRTRAGPGRCRA